MKKTVGIFIIILVLSYFIVGYIFVQSKWLDNDFYNISIAIISGIASVVTIYSMFSQSSLRNELNSVQPSLLKDITKNIQTLNKQKLQLEDTKIKLSEQEKQLLLLEIKKGELEVIVKKASLSIFLHDQLERNSKRLKEIIDKHSELNECIQEREKIENKLHQLDEEIKRDENYEFLNNLLKKEDSINRNSNPMLSNPIIKKMYFMIYGENM